MLEFSLALVVTAATLVAVIILIFVVVAVARRQSGLPETLVRVLEERHMGMIRDLNAGLNSLGDRLGASQNEMFERLRNTITQELTQTRSTVGALQVRQVEELSATRETTTLKLAEMSADLQSKHDLLRSQVLTRIMETMAEQNRAEQELIQTTMRNASAQLSASMELLPPTGMVAVDAKFPLENYRRMFEAGLPEPERAAAQRQFRGDVKKHVDDIAGKYIIAGETSDGAVMFVPAEAVFAEIHAYHWEGVEYAQAKRVWIVSPTTLMAVLNTARAVLRDVETRKQVHVIKDALARLAADFRRFDERMKKLADHIRQAHEDANEVQTSSRKISQQFQKIESVELEPPVGDSSNVVRLTDERKPGAGSGLPG